MLATLLFLPFKIYLCLLLHYNGAMWSLTWLPQALVKTDELTAVQIGVFVGETITEGSHSAATFYIFLIQPF